MLDSIIQKDKELLIFLNNLGSEQWDSFWLFITNQFNWIPLFVFVLYLVFKNFGLKKGMFLLVIIAVMIAFSDQFTNMIRGIFERLRPNNDDTVNHLLRKRLINPQSFSFTSGHATTSTVFAVFVYQLFKNVFPKYIKLIFLFPIVFAYSRIYLGVHFPIDITVGAINGTIIGYAFFKLYSYLSNKIFT
ncbi:phosphoesterase [Tenacibaculum holothuriorum]|uniref:Phosphoesterase n=1 Tax=Tenacibaculum holothuriorum TaxID=1635173 RepID=A0A1Y2PAZ9_9FLAO|nr:phosphatase PAP2 family protein [Tenacibaculum holothuriorum]OSY87643.1 phosphoesterase [Tenacibaculum holothuriorum]